MSGGQWVTHRATNGWQENDSSQLDGDDEGCCGCPPQRRTPHANIALSWIARTAYAVAVNLQNNQLRQRRQDGTDLTCARTDRTPVTLGKRNSRGISRHARTQQRRTRADTPPPAFLHESRAY